MNRTGVTSGIPAVTAKNNTFFFFLSSVIITVALEIESSYRNL